MEQLKATSIPNRGYAQPKTSQFQSVLSDATKYFTPQAMQRSKTIPISFMAQTNKAFIPGGIYNSGLVWGSDSPYGVYSRGGVDRGSIQVRANMGQKTADVLRHELIHSFDKNVNTPRMQFGNKMVTDPILELKTKLGDIYSGARILDSSNLKSNLKINDKVYLSKFGPSEYSQSPAEALAFLNNTPASMGRLKSFYKNAIKYPNNMGIGQSR